MNDRLPCPYCGDRMDDYDLQVWEINVKEYAISCRNCGASGPNGVSKNDATDMWNLRREPKAEVQP
jgi:Lar family restriction alleviation protein